MWGYPLYVQPSPCAEDQRGRPGRLLQPGSLILRKGVILRLVPLLILAVLLAGCRQAPAPGSERPLPVRLAYTTQLDSALVHLALVRGYFREEGVEVLPTVLSFGKQALGAVLAGEADLATVAETPVMFAALDGERLSVVASIFSSGMNHAVVVNRKSGVSRIEHLRGKRIGFTGGTTSEFFLSCFLLANGIARAEIVPVHMPPERMHSAIMSGEVDAVSAWTPHQKLITGALGQNGSVHYDPDSYTETFVLAGRPGYVEQNQEAVRRVLRALLKAEKFAAQHPAEAQAVIAGFLELAPDLLRECWAGSLFRVSIDHALLITLEEETRWAMKHGMAGDAKMPNYLDFMDVRALMAVKPEAVNVKVISSEIH